MSGLGLQLIGGPAKAVVLGAGEKEIWFNKSFGLHLPLYNMAAEFHQLFYGHGSYLSWDPAHYYDRRAYAGRAAKWKARAFQRPERPFAILNLNTLGSAKVMDLAPDYAQRLREFLVFFRDRHPDVNLFVAPPEAHFGDSVQNEARALIQSFAKGGSVAALPDGEKRVWYPLMEDASLVLSQDSGFAHVAQIFSRRVMIMGRGTTTDDVDPVRLAFADEPRRWAKPGHFWGLFGDARTTTPHAEWIFNWVAESLSSPSSRR